MSKCPISPEQWEDWTQHPVTQVLYRHLNLHRETLATQLYQAWLAGQVVAPEVQKDFQAVTQTLSNVTGLTYRDIASRYPDTWAEIQAAEDKQTEDESE